MLSLRLYAPEVVQKPPRDSYLADTLRQAFEIHFAPSLVGKTPATKYEYLRALEKWEELTVNPQIGEIDDLICECFRRAAMEDSIEDYSAATVNKWQRHLAAIINRLGPKGPRNRRGKSIIVDVPYFEPLPETEPDPVNIPTSELDKMYLACRTAEWPISSKSGCFAPDLWRAVLVLAITYGPRRSDLFNLKWKQINFDANTISWRAKKTGKYHLFPLTPIVRAHLEEIHSDREFVLSISSSNHYLYRAFHEIQNFAKVRHPSGDYYGFHHLRQTCAARSDIHCPGTAAVILGHAIRTVTQRNYLGDASMQAAWNCIKSCPPPPSFATIIDRIDQRKAVAAAK